MAMLKMSGFEKKEKKRGGLLLLLISFGIVIM